MRLIVIALFILFARSAIGQYLPVGLSAQELKYRDSQVLFNVDTLNSLLIRPFRIDTNSSVNLSRQKLTSGLPLYVYPLTLNSVYSSHHTYPDNTFPVIPSKGVQTHYSFGVFSSWGQLHLQLVPQIVQVFHPNYRGFPDNHAPVTWANRYVWWNRIDEPETFSDKPFIKVGWGQTSIRYNFRNVSIAASTENMYWGPGKHNSLILSNNAYGFPHLSLSSIKPQKTKIGSFEWKVFWGLLESSGRYPPDTARVDGNSKFYAPKYGFNRFSTGAILVYQPKFSEGLSLGFANVIQQYSNSLYWNDVFSAVTSAFVNGEGTGDNVSKHQISSFFLRWLFAEANGEMYLEYAIQNPRHDFRNMLEGNNQRAYTIGVSKAHPISQRAFLKLDIEHTQLQQSPYRALDGKSFYIDPYVRHGYTHKGKVLGAQIGSGSNLQSVALSYEKRKVGAGISYQRLAHNNDFHYFAFRDFRRFWVDRVFGFNANISFKKIDIVTRIAQIKSINYQWEHPANSNLSYFSPGNDVSSIQVFVQISYKL